MTLDKRNAKLLHALYQICDNNYKVIEFGDIVTRLPLKYRLDTELINDLKYLAEHGYIDIRYFDNEVVCMCMLTKGKLCNEEMEQDAKRKKKSTMTIIALGIMCAVCAFIGSLLGVILSRYIC